MKPQDVIATAVEGGLKAVNMVVGIPGKVLRRGDHSGHTEAGRAAEQASPPLEDRPAPEPKTATAQRAKRPAAKRATAAKKKPAAKKPAAKKPAARKPKSS